MWKNAVTQKNVENRIRLGKLEEMDDRKNTERDVH